MTEKCNVCSLEVYGPTEYQGSARDQFWPKNRHRVAFADSASWSMVGAASQVLALVNDLDMNSVGNILISPNGPNETLDEIIEMVARGRVSPMRFPAATPSSLLAPTSIIFGLQGPSLNLVAHPDEAIPVVSSIAARWFANFHLEAVLISIVVTVENNPTAKSLLIKSIGQVPNNKEVAACLDLLHPPVHRRPEAEV